MRRAKTDALWATLCLTLILSLGCPGSATLSDFLGEDLTGLLAGALGDAGGNTNANRAIDDSSNGENANANDNGDANANGDAIGNANQNENGNANGNQNANGGGNDNDNDNSDDSNGNGSPGADLRIAADLTGSSAASGQAEFRRETGRRSFKVEVEDFPAGIYGVFLNGVQVAEIEVGSSGFAEIEFDSRTESGHVPFPSDFPESIEEGDTVRVGELVEGTF